MFYSCRTSKRTSLDLLSLLCLQCCQPININLLEEEKTITKKTFMTITPLGRKARAQLKNKQKKMEELPIVCHNWLKIEMWKKETKKSNDSVHTRRRWGQKCTCIVVSHKFFFFLHFVRLYVCLIWIFCLLLFLLNDQIIIARPICMRLWAALSVVEANNES